jgi:hypothetical protein
LLKTLSVLLGIPWLSLGICCLVSLLLFTHLAYSVVGISFHAVGHKAKGCWFCWLFCEI